MITERKQRLRQQQLYISCIVPVYNEAELIVAFLTALHTKLSALSKKFEIIVVDDGSQDETPTLIKKLIANFNIKLIILSRNFGKEKAITAGLEHADGDVAILIDADFQHPLEIIPQFLTHWAEGNEMVYGIRSNREDETWLKRFFAHCFYRLMRILTRVKIPANAGDFRLLDRKLIDAINQCRERGRFMKGLYNWVGFKSIGIPFTVNTRPAGKSAWKLKSLTGLALTGITAFSNVPLRAWGLIGLVISLFSFCSVVYIILSTLIFGADVPGYTTLIVTIVFFGGIQLLSIGILGEYIGRIFEEVKNRPQYVIADKIGFNEARLGNDQ